MLGNFLADYTAKRSGREAYYAGDYQTCYQNLMGKELDETEQVMYSQSESILTIRMWLREYEVFVTKALNWRHWTACFRQSGIIRHC